MIERRSRRHEVRDIGDVHPDAQALALGPYRDRIVEVLRGLGVDRERVQVAQVGSALEARLRKVVRLEALPQALLDEQRLEDVLDRLGRPDHPLDARPSAALADGDEIAGLGVLQPLPVDRDRSAGDEVRLADEQLAAPTELDDQSLMRRKRRIVIAEPAAPSTRPSAGAASARCSANAIAFTSSPASIAADRRRQDELLAEEEQDDGRDRSEHAVSRPSTTNGPRTNQFEAPTSFITSISRRRAKIESRIVLPIRIVAATSRITIASADEHLEDMGDAQDSTSAVFFAEVDVLDAGRQRVEARSAIATSSSPRFGVHLERVGQRIGRNVLRQLGLLLPHHLHRLLPSRCTRPTRPCGSFWSLEANRVASAAVVTSALHLSGVQR